MSSNANAVVAERNTLGFWVYLMSDCVIFASLFATFAVLRGELYGVPPASELFSLPFVLAETLVLLMSSFTAGLALLAMYEKHVERVLLYFGVTLFLGISFLSMEIYEFANLIIEGAGPSASAYMSAFFALLGTHGTHVFFGAVWMVVVVAQMLMWGINATVTRRFMLATLFWHFLDIIWIFIFTFVFLLSMI